MGSRGDSAKAVDSLGIAPPGNGSVVSEKVKAEGSKADQVIYYTYEVVAIWPHDTGAFTEGLFFLNGNLYESTGLNGESSVRKVDLTSGRVVKKMNLSPDYFGEGLAVFGDRLIQLTWRNNQAFVYRLSDFAPIDQFYYIGEGWGLTSDRESLIMSDGSDSIRFLDPATFKTVRTINVTLDGKPMRQLNELEYIQNEIYANIWQTNSVARIDPKTGRVLGLIDFSGLLKPQDYLPGTDVLNGIAYDSEHDRLFVTGKKWPKLFEVRLKPLP